MAMSATVAGGAPPAESLSGVASTRVCSSGPPCRQAARHRARELRGGIRPLSELSCATFRMPHCPVEAVQPIPT
jgi:hypothetical protein